MHIYVLILKKVIYLQKIGDVDDIVLKKLKKNLKRRFFNHVDSVEVLEKKISLSSLQYHPEKKQYDVSFFLNCLKKFVKNKNQFRTLAIIDKDIYTNDYNFIFGRAHYPSNEFLKTNGVALISIYRLRESFYGRSENKRLFKSRILKEAIHEIGHTFNIKHCKKYCVMQYSSSLDEADRKPLNFCKSCLKEIDVFLNNISV
ncbi:MAG: hypothetical protein EU540_04655 [Promethearchaeota archaeon]|nr:MAG: hypothetical protein EU540_04655 [Candidatus Lokiarchaeota archaeon]